MEESNKRETKNSLGVDPENIYISLWAITGGEGLKDVSIYQRCPPK